ARFPREKACGECLNPGGVAALERLGLLETVLGTQPVELRGWRLRTPEGPSAVGRFGPGVGHALGIRRGAFDHALLDRARAGGVTVLEGFQLQGLELGAGLPVVRGREVGSGNVWEMRPRIVVGADGLRSMVARLAGARARPARRVKASLSWHLEGPYPDEPLGRLLLGGPFTSGLAPVANSVIHATDGSVSEGSTWSHTVVVDPRHYAARLRSDAEGLGRDALNALLPEHADRFAPLGPPRASGPFDSPVRWAGRGRVVLVGDAAGYYDPLTGQGIYRALRSAELAAPLLRRGLNSPGSLPAMMQQYDRSIRRAFTPGRRIQRILDRALESPRLRRFGVGILSRRPAGADTLVGITGDRLPPRALLTPSAWSDGAWGSSGDPSPSTHSTSSA
ncbi:MAG: hypothetical protein EA351_04780, partial [Gemmatimonadales bacterium]